MCVRVQYMHTHACLHYPPFIRCSTALPSGQSTGFVCSRAETTNSGASAGESSHPQHTHDSLLSDIFLSCSINARVLHVNVVDDKQYHGNSQGQETHSQDLCQDSAQELRLFDSMQQEETCKMDVMNDII